MRRWMLTEERPSILNLACGFGKSKELIKKPGPLTVRYPIDPGVESDSLEWIFEAFHQEDLEYISSDSEIHHGL